MKCEKCEKFGHGSNPRRILIPLDPHLPAGYTPEQWEATCESARAIIKCPGKKFHFIPFDYSGENVTVLLAIE